MMLAACAGATLLGVPGVRGEALPPDEGVEALMASAGAPGMAAALVGPEGLRWWRGYGYADLATRTPMTADTVFPLASVSKSITATAMMIEVSAGGVDLDRDVTSYLSFAIDNPHAPGAVITLRHLGAHVSGIQDRDAVYESPTSYHYGGDNPLRLGDFLREYLVASGRYYSRDNFNGSPPRGRFQYCNVCAGLVGHVVESTSGQSFNRYTRQRLFEPLGMSSTGWFLGEVDRARHVTLYKPVVGGFEPYPSYGLATWPDGGVRSTLRDMARFLAMILGKGSLEGHRVLSEDAVREMLGPQRFDGARIPSLPPHRDQGLFWMHVMIGGRTLIGHSGSDPGVSTRMFFDAGLGVGVLLFVNTDQERATPLLDRMQADLFDWAEAAATASPREPARALASWRYPGTRAHRTRSRG
jgi:CubicO group peptidase (beta-lactamase class C family)